MPYTGDGVSGYREEIQLRPRDALAIGSPIVERFPFLIGCMALELPLSMASDVKQVIALSSAQPFHQYFAAVNNDCGILQRPLLSFEAFAMQVQTLLQAQLVVSVTESDGTSVDATGAFLSCPVLRRHH